MEPLRGMSRVEEAVSVRLADEPKIDCHCHVIDPVAFPYQAATPYRPAGQEIGTPAQIAEVFAAHGVRRALLVQPNSGYGEDLRCLIAALDASEGRYRGIAVVAHDISLPDLARLKARGIVGVAFNLAFHGADYYRRTEALLAKLVELDMFLQIQTEQDQLLSLLPLIERSDVRLLFDHCSRPVAEAGIGQPAFQAALAFGRSGRAVVKLSGFAKFSQLRHPFADTRPFVRALEEAFTLDRCVWGSDWPFLRATERIDYGPLLTLAAELFPEPGDRKKLFWETPLRVFGFDRGIEE